MDEIKIKKIKNLNDVKTIFNFMSSTFLQETIKYGEAFVPLHELYESMIDNLTHDKDLQFYCVVNKQPVGVVISTPLPYDSKALMLNIIAVKDEFRRSGIANVLLAEIEMIARRKGYERIRVRHNYGAERFFAKNNYALYLELAIPESLEIESVLKLNNLGLQYKSLTKYNNINFVEYVMESADPYVLHYISRNTPLVKALYVLEKKFWKREDLT